MNSELDRRQSRILDKPLLVLLLVVTSVFLSKSALGDDSNLEPQRVSIGRAIAAVSSDQLRDIVEKLASDKYEGRGAGYPGDRLATEYLVKRFQELGLNPAGESDSYVQEFVFQVHSPILPWQTLTTRNVLAMIPGSDPELNRDIIVLAAHHDGQGMLGQADYFRYVPQTYDVADDPIWNSANDDATGVASVLEIARVLESSDVDLKRSVLFVLFGAEEPSMGGSVFYVNHPTVKWSRHVAMIELEKLGREPGEPLFMASFGTSDMWHPLAERVEQEYNYPIVPIIEELITDTDHYPFAVRKVPAIVLGRGSSQDSHAPTDTSEKIDYQTHKSRTQAVLAMLIELSNARTAPVYRHHESAELLGIVVAAPTPDELEYLGIDGMGGAKVMSVIQGLPAANAGMAEGDLIVSIGGEVVPIETDIGMVDEIVSDQYKHAKTWPLTMTVRRGEQLIKLEVFSQWAE